MTGQLYAQVAWIAWRDADVIEERGTLERSSPYADRPTLGMTERAGEAVRLRQVAARLAYRAHELGFHASGLDAVFA